MNNSQFYAGNINTAVCSFLVTMPYFSPYFGFFIHIWPTQLQVSRIKF